MNDPFFHPQYMPELLEDDDERLPRLRQYNAYDNHWLAYEAAGEPYGHCCDGMMEWLCEQRGIKTKAWFHVL